ncbi:MAG: AraC family transcriptional regulator ligand-binding domain-containing protein [Kiloniellales bacterium]|nr:AraC family transcriptional regulator ligand-binding domain-containing protein [Kiloniellales bacterium]
METIALTRAGQLIHVTDTLERLGLSAEEMLRQGNLPPWHYCHPDDLIPTQHIYALLGQAARRLGNRALGLRVGLESSIETLGSYGKVIASAPTIKQAFETSCRLLHLHTSAAHIWLIPAGEEVWFCRSRFRGPKIGRWQMEQYVLMRLIDHVRMGMGPSWRPAKVRLQATEAPGCKLREALGDPEIRIGQSCTAIAVPRTLLAQPLRWRAGPPQARQEEQARLWQTAPAQGFIDALRQLAETLLKLEGPPQISTMAGLTGLSVRSFQRRLAQHGLTHFQIVDQARYRAATRLLADADIRITDIGLDLGYTDSAHFTRAFRRWAGVTPREYRSHRLTA